MVITYGQLYRKLREVLEPSEGANASFTARELLAYAADVTPAGLLAMQNTYVSDAVLEQALALTKRALKEEPLAYLIGKWDFCGLTLTVTKDVLIPRDDTMAVVELALEYCQSLSHPPRILDLCTGSGCIGLALASRVPGARVTLADLSPAALKVAKKNVTDLHLSARVTCLSVNALAPADAFLGQFDLIVSNPPYITKEEMAALPPSVKEYEPSMALDGGGDGLDFYRAIPVHFSSALKPGGCLCMEFGMGQEEAVCQLLRQSNYVVSQLRNDSGGIIRAVMAMKKERNEDHGDNG